MVPTINEALLIRSIPAIARKIKTRREQINTDRNTIYGEKELARRNNGLAFLIALNMKKEAIQILSAMKNERCHSVLAQYGFEINPEKIGIAYFEKDPSFSRYAGLSEYLRASKKHIETHNRLVDTKVLIFGRKITDRALYIMCNLANRRV
jgi:hypothetical protein